MVSEDKNYISCPRYGGFKPPSACVYYDKYLICRRKCESLEKYIEENPGVIDEAIEKGKKRVKDRSKKFKASKVGKDLPNSELRCPYCKDFVAKSIRGLKTHCTRTHKVTYGKKKKSA